MNWGAEKSHREIDESATRYKRGIFRSSSEFTGTERVAVVQKKLIDPTSSSQAKILNSVVCPHRMFV